MIVLSKMFVTVKPYISNDKWKLQYTAYISHLKKYQRIRTRKSLTTTALSACPSLHQKSRERSRIFLAIAVQVLPLIPAV